MLIADIRATREYLTELARLGMINISRRNLGWRMWWSGPWLATRLVIAHKPSPGDGSDTVRNANLAQAKQP